MIESILPPSVAVHETRGDLATDLTAAEQEAVGNAVEKRRLEFTTGRACARRALAQLGVAADGVPAGPRGEPLWPPGTVGAITHCAGYRAAAVAQTSELASIGIDAEPNAPLPDGLLPDVASPSEIAALYGLAAREPAVHWDRLLFSAKESVYKAWFPLTGRWLGFEDAELTIDPHAKTFQARLLVPATTAAGEPLTGFSGRWLCDGGLVLTAIARPRETP